jgi:hypothetical protein
VRWDEPVAKLVTANRLSDGAVVYFDAAGGWSLNLTDALVAADDAHAEALLERAAPAVEARLIVEPYLMEVAAGATGVRPLRERERIRAAGPTVRRDLGKQAEGAGFKG